MENMFSNICHLSHQHIFSNSLYVWSNIKRVGNPVATNKFGLPNWNSSQNGQTITGLEKGKIKLS